MPKAIVIDPVMTKSFKRYGTVYPGKATEYKATIVPGESITIECEKGRYSKDLGYAEEKFKRTFKIGETAEYDSYNLSYTGEIVNISTKTVTIVAYKGTIGEKNHRLDINRFAWRNYDFDAVKTAERNHETMMYI